MEPTTQNSSVLEGIPYLEMGGGFLIGLSIGYVLKKSFKILLILLGISLITIFVLESKGVITLNEAGLQESVSHGMEMFKHFLGFLKDRLTNFQVAGGLSAVAGFAAGLKMG